MKPPIPEGLKTTPEFTLPDARSIFKNTPKTPRPSDNFPEKPKEIRFDKKAKNKTKEITLEFKEKPKELKRLPLNTDAITFKNNRLKANQELLTIKKAVGKATKESHNKQILERIAKFKKDHLPNVKDASLADQIKRMEAIILKKGHDLTQIRRLRKIVKKDYQKHIRKRR